MTGDINYFYKKGSIKRIEHMDYSEQRDSSVLTIGIPDGVGPEGCWRYYRRNGKLKEKHNYAIKVYSCVPLSYCFVVLKTKYKRNEEIKSYKEKKLFD